MNGLARWFLEPGALPFLLSVPVLVALWMLRLRRDPMIVPSTLLWERLLTDRHVNRPMERLRKSLALLLQLFILIALVAALMRPFTRGAALTGERVIFVLDTTASMQATDVAPSRFAAARAEAARRLASLPAECEAMIVEAGPRPAVAAPFTRDRALLEARLAALAPADAGGDLVDALGLAAELAHPRGGVQAKVWVFSDGGPALVHQATRRTRGAGLDPASVSFFRVGGAADNVAVVQVQARRVAGRTADYEVFAQVASFAAARTAVTADLLRDERLVDSRKLDLGAGERTALVFTGSHAGAARLTVALRVADHLQLDDRAYAALPAAVTRRVTMVGEPEPWLARALTLLPGIATGPGLTIAVGTVPDPWPAGPVWLVAPRTSSPAGRVEGALSSASVLESESAHPVLADVSLARLRIDAAVRMRPAAGLVTLVTGVAGADEVPLLAAGELAERGEATGAGRSPVFVPGSPGEGTTSGSAQRSDEPGELAERGEATGAGRSELAVARGAARTVLMAFRPADSELPQKAALPLLVANVMDWVFEPEERAVAIRAGTPLPIRGDEELTVRDPAGETEHAELGARGRHADRAGFWTLQPARGAARVVAVNLADAAESDLSPGPGPALSGRTLAELGPPAESDRELTRPLLVLVFALLVLEWIVHHRRWAA